MKIYIIRCIDTGEVYSKSSKCLWTLDPTKFAIYTTVSTCKSIISNYSRPWYNLGFDNVEIVEYTLIESNTIQYTKSSLK